MTLANATIPAFYQLPEYVPMVNKPVHRRLDPAYLHFSEQSAPAYAEILERYGQPVFERAGMLQGEYLVWQGLILIRRDGSFIKSNMSLDDQATSDRFDTFFSSPDFLAIQKEILDAWDRTILVESTPFISHPFAQNYFHWSTEGVTKNRFFDQPKQVLVLEMNLRRVFQRELVAYATQGKKILCQDYAVIRVKNPLAAHEFMSEEGIHWLRRAVNIPVRTGNKRIYLRRSQGGSRNVAHGGAISETPQFLAFLREYGFEIIDFGNDKGIHEQASMLDGAGIILAPHGAALTNLAYLNPPVSVIEIMGPVTTGAMFMHLANMLKLHYYGIFNDSYDAQSNIMVDMDELRGCMQECLALA